MYRGMNPRVVAYKFYECDTFASFCGRVPAPDSRFTIFVYPEAGRMGRERINFSGRRGIYSLSFAFDLSPT